MLTLIQEMQWVLRAQCSDREALEMLLRSVQPSLRRYLSGLVGRTDADDLLQDVMVIVIRKLGGLDDPQVFRPWAFRIASREAFRHIKKRHLWIGQHEDDSQLDDLPTPETRPSGELLRQLLATERISPASRAVLILHFQEAVAARGRCDSRHPTGYGEIASRLRTGVDSKTREEGRRLTWLMTLEMCYADHLIQSIVTGSA